MKKRMANVSTEQASEKKLETIAQYVSDMAAVESHIEEALDRQLKEVSDDPAALAAVREFHDTVKRHRDSLRGAVDDLGVPVGSTIKDVGSALLGKAAGLIDLVRAEGTAKSLRDDYAAFSLAAIGYSMLHTTSLSLGNTRIASLAERHLQDQAVMIMRINEIMPDVVARELKEDGLQVDQGAAASTRKAVAEAWKSR